MANVTNQAASAYGYQGLGTDWNTTGDLFIWDSASGLNDIGITFDASALDAADVVSSATLDLVYGGFQNVNALYSWSIRAVDADNPANFSGANLPRNATLRAATVNDSVTATPSGAYQATITSIISDLVSNRGGGNIGNIGLVISAATASEDYVSWAAGSGATLNIVVGGGSNAHYTSYYTKILGAHNAA